MITELSAMAHIDLLTHEDGSIGLYYNPDQPPKPEKPIIRDGMRGSPSVGQSTCMESVSGHQGLEAGVTGCVFWIYRSDTGNGWMATLMY